MLSPSLSEYKVILKIMVRPEVPQVTVTLSWFWCYALIFTVLV